MPPHLAAPCICRGSGGGGPLIGSRGRGKTCAMDRLARKTLTSLSFYIVTCGFRPAKGQTGSEDGMVGICQVDAGGLGRQGVAMEGGAVRTDLYLQASQLLAPEQAGGESDCPGRPLR